LADLHLRQLIYFIGTIVQGSTCTKTLFTTYTQLGGGQLKKVVLFQHASVNVALRFLCWGLSRGLECRSISFQCDQMSLWINHPKCGPTAKKVAKNGATSVIFKKLHKVNNHTMGKNSSDPVTLSLLHTSPF
jgi:hypothetical protein